MKLSKNKKLKATITYNKKIAKRYHDTSYYESIGDDIQNYVIKELDKEILSTRFKKDITQIIEERKKLGESNKPSKVFKLLDKIFSKNLIRASKGLPPVHDNLMNIISHPDTLKMAYKTIRKNKGALTPGGGYSQWLTSDQKEIAHDLQMLPDGISNTIFEEISKLIKTGQWVWGASNRIYIDKPGKINEKRPLTIRGFMDRMVQEAIKMVLETIYEPWFEKMNCSFRFRPNKGCHDAITYLQTCDTLPIQNHKDRPIGFSNNPD